MPTRLVLALASPMRLLLAAILISLAGLAHAQQIPCAPRDDMLALLKDKYQEQPIGFGAVGATAMIELTVSPRGSWTLLMTSPQNISCAVAAGQNWEVLRAPGQDA